MKITQIEVSYGRTVSDGNYGSERAKVALTSSVGEDEDYREVFTRLADQATDMAIAKLKQSTSERVLAAVETPEEREARWDRERDAARERAARPRPDPVLLDEEDDPERPF